MSVRPQPVSDAEFAAALGALGVFDARPRLGVAVSGGADSTALACLASRFAGVRGGQVTAYTVDHRMRPESAGEAALVASRLTRFGINHRILVWTGGRSGAGHARARDARLGLLIEAAAADGVADLLLAQHADDQAETILMRLAKGSGVDGLAGIPAVRVVGRVRLLRPLLDVPKSRLVATCRMHGLEWIEDPSNLDQRFERGRIRRRLNSLVAEGSEVRDGLLAVAAAAATLRNRQDAILDGFEAVRLHALGYADVALADLRGLPLPIARRLLARLIHQVGGSERPPGDAATDRLLARILDPVPGGPTTLARARAIRTGDRLRLVREARDLPAPIKVSGDLALTWDRRLSVTVACPGRAAWLRPLVKEEALELSRRANVPFEVALTLPCLDCGDAEILWPDVSTRNGDPMSARVRPLIVEWMPASADGRTSSLFGRFGALSSVVTPFRGAGRRPEDVRAPL